MKATKTALVAVHFVFICVAGSRAQSSPPKCRTDYAESKVTIAVGDVDPTAINWFIDDVPLDVHSTEFAPEFSAAETGTNTVEARDSSGALLCSLVIVRRLYSAPMFLSIAELNSEAHARPAAPPVFDEKKKKPKAAAISVYFATERMDLAEGLGIFQKPRDPAGRIHYGRTVVYVPEAHKRVWIEDPNYWHYKQSDFSADRGDLLSEMEFYRELMNEVKTADPHEKQVLIFIHGFNNGFEEDLFKAAQLKYDTAFRGTMIMWDWPSKDGTLDYIADRTSVSASSDDLASFLTDVRQRTGADKVNIIAHSMGCRLLLEALAGMQKADRLPTLAQVILAAPDIDTTRFEQITSRLMQAQRISRLTVYGSKKDWAMWLSTKINGISPVGAMPPYSSIHGFDQIDASKLPMDFLGHDYFITTKPILRDIGTILFKPNVSAADRPSLVSVQSDVWQIGTH